MRAYRIAFACCLTILLLWIYPVYVSAQGASVVTDCSRYDSVGGLRTALASGKPVQFACSGMLVVPEIIITTDTSLDASGQNVTLSGNQANRVFCVDSATTLN